MILASMIAWHLVVMPIWITPPKANPIVRDAAMTELLKPYDSGLTFDTEAQCREFIDTSSADGIQNMKALLLKRGLPDYFSANSACTRE